MDINSSMIDTSLRLSLWILYNAIFTVEVPKDARKIFTKRYQIKLNLKVMYLLQIKPPTKFYLAFNYNFIYIIKIWRIPFLSISK